jgi:hypothetical protein
MGEVAWWVTIIGGGLGRGDAVADDPESELDGLGLSEQWGMASVEDQVSVWCFGEAGVGVAICEFEGVRGGDA